MAYLGRRGALAPVSTADIPDNSITSAKIVDGAVAVADLGPNSVDSSELVDGSIDTSHIADDQVTGDKLANDIAISTTGAITTTGAFTSVGIDDNADALAMTIDANENVCIGVAAPTGSGTKFQVKSATDSHFRVADLSGTVRLSTANDANNAYVPLRIDASTLGLLHVTPKATWRSNCKAIQFGTQSALWESNLDNTLISQNVYEHTDTDRKYINDGEASYYYQYNGGHYWDCHASGTADTSLSAASGSMALLNNGSVTINGGYHATGADNGVTILDGGYAYEYRSSSTNTNLSWHMAFYNPNGHVGTITTSASATSYSTSSDYRLKENVVAMSGSIDRLKTLKPSRFNFIADRDKTVDGFIAHEAQVVVPEAITGEKDAMRMEEYEVTPAVEEVRDEDGNITTEAVPAVMGEREVPDMQGIDQSKLVPLLVGALQEAITRIEALESA